MKGRNSPLFQRKFYALAWLLSELTIGQTSHAQVPTFEWAVKAGSRESDRGNAVAVDASGNCFVTGTFYEVANFGETNLTSFGGTDIFVAKYSAVGALLWVRQAGGAVDDAGRGVAVDSLGNCYVVGDFGWSAGGTAIFGNTNVTSAGGNDAFVAKYNSNGDLEWVRTYGSGDFDWANGIAVDAQGNSWITGSSGNGLVFVVKYNPAGILQWTRSGGSAYAAGAAIAIDGLGNSFITGRFSGTGSFGNTTLTNQAGLAMFVVKYDNDGVLQWATQAAATPVSVGSQVWSTGIATDHAGNCFVAGYFGYDYGITINFGAVTLTNAGGHDIFLAKYNPAGTPQWALRAGGSDYDYCSAVATDESGNCFITGTFNNQATIGTTTLSGLGERFFAARFDGDGTPQWALQAEGTDYT